MELMNLEWDISTVPLSNSSILRLDLDKVPSEFEIRAIQPKLSDRHNKKILLFICILNTFLLLTKPPFLSLLPNPGPLLLALNLFRLPLLLLNGL